MSIHQLSVAYQADQDRLLLRVRTRDEQLFELWLTRRLMLRLWRPLQDTANAAALGAASKGSTILPEARDMLSQTLREQAQENADFSSPFDESAAARPLGEQPLLVAAVDLTRQGNGHVEVSLRDAASRHLSLNLSPELLSNLLSLVERALHQSEWGLVATAEASTSATVQAPPAPRVLN